MNDFEDDRPRYGCRVDALHVGDRIFTAAARWETVTSLDSPQSGAVTRICTDTTGPGYGWPLPNWYEVPAVPMIRVFGEPAVYLHDTREQVLAFVGTRPLYHQNRNAPILASAGYQGRGQGWDVMDRPGGRDIVRTSVASKAAAMSAIVRAAKAHAKALRLPLRRPEPGAGGRW